MSEKKAATLSLAARSRGGYILLEVSDTGEGIEKKGMSRLFDLDYSTKGISDLGYIVRVP